MHHIQLQLNMEDNLCPDLDNTSALEVISGPNSTTGENDAPDFLLARAFLAVIHSGTFLTLCFYAYVTHARVEVSHPVFAVVFQEILALAALETVAFLNVLVVGVSYEFYVVPLVCIALAMQVHQWSWFAVTCLR